MEITYRLKYKDLVWFSFYCLPRTRANQLSYLFILLLSILLGGIIILDTKMDFFSSIIVVFFVSLLMQALVGITLVIWYLLVPRMGHFQKVLQNDIKVTMNETEYKEETGFGIQITPWNKLNKIIETDNYIVILVSELCGNIIPNRVFPNSEKAHSFYVFAKTQLVNAKGEI